MFRMPEDYCVMGAHLRCVVVVAIRKTGFVRAFLLEKDVHTTSSDIHATDRNRVLRGPPIGQVG